jgi:YggT family protein
MGGGYLNEALRFLIRTLFELYIVAVALRFLFQWVRADFYNPISQFLVKVTNPPLRPLRRVIPGYAGIDLASVVLMIALKALEIAVLSLIAAGSVPAPAGLLVISLAEILRLIIWIFIIAILIQVVLSWVNPGAYNPATVLLFRLTEPMLAPARRLIPPVGGLDLSPIAVFIFLQLTLILLVKPLAHWGYSLAGFMLR